MVRVSENPDTGFGQWDGYDSGLTHEVDTRQGGLTMENLVEALRTFVHDWFQTVKVSQVFKFYIH